MSAGTTQRGATAWMRHHVARDKIWRVIDAKDQVLGRVASQAAKILQGRHKVMYMDNMDCGDPVIVINARHISLTGRKRYTKVYVHHTGYPGGRKEVPIDQVREKRPDDIIRRAVKGMLPANRLRRSWLSNLRIYQDDKHDHHAQKPALLAPVCKGRRIGSGGPPTYEELNYWWIEHLIHVPDGILREVVQEVRDEINPDLDAAKMQRGIAELLALPSDEEHTDLEKGANTRYITAIENSLKEDPVVIPRSLQ